MAIQGDGDEEGGGSDIGALLGNLGPLIGGLSGVSYNAACCLRTAITTTTTATITTATTTSNSNTTYISDCNKTNTLSEVPC